MKFQIRKSENQFSGTDMFHVYQWDDSLSRWSYKGGSGDEKDCHAMVERLKNPKPEVVIAEIEG